MPNLRREPKCRSSLKKTGRPSVLSSSFESEGSNSPIVNSLAG